MSETTAQPEPEWEAEDIDDVYLFAPEWIERLNARPDAMPSLILFDRPGNHLVRRSNGLKKRVDGRVQEFACLLLSNGHVINWQGDSDEYAEWADAFVSGEHDARPYPPGIEERVKESWDERTRYAPGP